jgi:hypothetical protein
LFVAQGDPLLIGRNPLQLSLSQSITIADARLHLERGTLILIVNMKKPRRGWIVALLMHADEKLPEE